MKGRCVICGNVGKLTRDHVPPKGVTRPTRIDISRLLPDEAELKSGRAKPRPGFQAPTFPSLCAECNSGRLGRLYDPALIAFSNEFATWARSKFQLAISLPDEARVDAKPALISRAVVGHLLAAEERKDPTAPLASGTMLDEMRKYFLGTPDFQPEFRIFVWPFVGAEITIVRGFGLMRVLGNTHDPIIGDLLKFFPFAFWVVSALPENVRLPYTELALLEENTCPIAISLKRVPPRRWPEMPDSEEIILYSDQRSHVARPSRRAT